MVIEDPAPAHTVFLIDGLQCPLTATNITRYSSKDQVISQTSDWVKRGWPKGTVREEFRPFKIRQNKLSTIQGCHLWGSWVVIPPQLRVQVLRALLKGHPGIVRVKALGWSYAWWPNLDKSITEWVSGCRNCQES